MTAPARGHVLRWGWSSYETAEDLARERRTCEALGLTYEAIQGRDAPAEALRRASAMVIPSWIRVDRAVLEQFGGDLVVATTSGVDHIDLPACEAAGVAVTRSPEARRDAVVEHTVASLIGLFRRLDRQRAWAREDGWRRDALPALAPRLLGGRTVGVVGLGVIGRRVVEVLQALGATVVGIDPHVPADALPVERATLYDALPRLQALTLHCALTSTSRGLVDGDALARLPRGAVVVNTARGESLDVPAAVDAVRRGHLGGLAVDVFATEPYPALGTEASVDGVWFTPHAAGYTDDLGQRVGASVAAALTAWSRGERLPHPVRSSDRR